MKLENWIITSNSFGDTLQDFTDLRKGLCPFAVVWGDNVGNPNFPEGRRLMTSNIVELLPGNKIRTYSGSIYELGSPLILPGLPLMSDLFEEPLPPPFSQGQPAA